MFREMELSDSKIKRFLIFFKRKTFLIFEEIKLSSLKIKKFQ